MKYSNLKILLPVVGYVLLVVSIVALQNVIAGIGLGIAGLLIFGPNVEEIRGKTGGIVYSKGKSGAYTRARVKGKNPQTNAQQVNRALHAHYMRLWKTAEVDHKAFIDYAAEHLVSNKVGEKVHLSGINWFLKFNRYAQKANPGAALITKPPVTDTLFPILTEVKLTASAAPESLIVEPIKIGEYVEGMRLEVCATYQLSAGVYSINNFRSIGVYNPSLSESIDITDDYVARFGDLKSGLKVFVKVRLIMPTGETSLFVGGSSVIN